MPQALGAEVCYFARYLGFLVGPCARDHAWEAPCGKLLERARHIKTLGLSLNETVLAFCVFAFSVIRFSLQLVPLSPVLIWNFGLALDICAPSPRYSLGVTYVVCSVPSVGWGCPLRCPICLLHLGPLCIALPMLLRCWIGYLMRCVLLETATGLCSALDIIFGLWSPLSLIWFRSGVSSPLCLALAH